jgi:TrpR family trp operon transcriptional repressor
MIKSKNLALLKSLLIDLKDSESAQDFLDSLLTPEELETLLMRLEIIKLLKQGYTQREVAQKLQVGIATVTRGAKEINKGHFAFIK